MTTIPPNTDPNAQGLTPTATDPQGLTPNPQGLTPTGPQPTPLESLPADVQEYIKSLRLEAEQSRKDKQAETKAKKQLEAAAQLAQQKQLEEQGQFKALAEQHAAHVQELEPIAAQYAALSTLVSGQIEAQIKDWPAEIKAFDPGEDAPIEQRLAWIKKSEPIIAKLQTQATRPGNSPNPPPGNRTSEDQRNAYTQKLRQSGKYGA